MHSYIGNGVGGDWFSETVMLAIGLVDCGRGGSEEGEGGSKSCLGGALRESCSGSVRTGRGDVKRQTNKII